METLRRLFRHVFRLPWQDSWLTDDALNRLEAATIAGEKGHGGEIRVVIERSLPINALQDDLQTRAERHFATLGLWNTADRSAILIYLNLAEEHLALVADTGITTVIGADTWQELCQKTSDSIRKGDTLSALITLIDNVAALLRRYYGKTDDPHGDELPNRPVIID